MLFEGVDLGVDCPCFTKRQFNQGGTSTNADLRHNKMGRSRTRPSLDCFLVQRGQRRCNGDDCGVRCRRRLPITLFVPEKLLLASPDLRRILLDVSPPILPSFIKVAQS